MNENNIIEVNAVLRLVGAFRMSDNEITTLDKAGHDPIDMEGYYSSANFVLQARSATNPRAQRQSDELAKLAKYDGFDIAPIIADVAKVNVPFFAGGL
jgi:hypothetical protein